jgi:transcriptional regulator with XRE-family HTH domain
LAKIGGVNMTFSENLNRICKERGVTLSALLKDMGVSTSKVTLWNNGSLPKQEMLIRLAHELHCSVMDFFQDGEDIEKSVQSPQEVLSEDEQDIIRFYRKISLREKHIFMARMYSYEENMEKQKE